MVHQVGHVGSLEPLPAMKLPLMFPAMARPRSHDVTGWLLCWHEGADCYGRTGDLHSPQCKTVVQTVVGLQHWESICRFLDMERSSLYPQAAALYGF